ncbi:glycosyltransferase family 4 protein [Acetobacter syzygii]|uniref:Hexosyltransferase n=1 Tax=Acetobacter syzygii TaxID=146476 RepID=A0A270BFR2_9PROT|nr:glycosyltransferase family 4 protein [Acetobacter syzygii]PAL23842.1 hexosyltransferase [Acetobacter syzygii]PAL24499.1 hexosyltransferase [Acetobacter syzygii]
MPAPAGGIAQPLRVMTVLPPRERFAPQEAGAIALLVHRMAAEGEVVVGSAPQTAPYADVPFAPVPDCLFPFSRMGRYRAGVARLLRTFRPDLVEVHNRPDLAWAISQRFPHVPLALVLHNDPCGMRAGKTPQERTALARKMAVVCVSDWLRARFLEQGVHGAVTVLPNALDLAVLPPPAPVREPVVLFAGRVVADKGVDAFVQACATLLPRHPTWQARIIGADRFGPNSPQTEFLNTLVPQALAAGVHMAGYQPHAQVLQAMSHAAIVVVPSRWSEPFGMAALEAMGCGAAVVTSRNGGLPGVAGEAALYASPDDLPGLVAVLERLMSDAGLRARMAQAGRARARLFDSAVIRPKRQAFHARLVQVWPHVAALAQA